MNQIDFNYYSDVNSTHVFSRAYSGRISRRNIANIHMWRCHRLHNINYLSDQIPVEKETLITSPARAPRFYIF